MSAKKSVRVRIAVAVNTRGHWSAAGCNGESKKVAADDAREAFGVEHDGFDSDSIVFIEATIPVPQKPKSVTVPGRTVKA